MTTSPTSQTGHRRADGAPLARAVLAAAVLQVLAPVVTIIGPGRSPGAGSGPDLLITPAGWAFSIWGVIYALAIAQAVAVLVRGAGSVSRRVQVDQVVLYAGAAVWIVLAGLDSSVATAAALIVMLVAGVDAVVTLARDVVDPRWLAVLTLGAVGLYAGWVTAACFLNVSTALVDAGVVEADRVGWQLVVMGLAVLALLTVLALSRGNLAYGAAGGWAMVGIAATGRDDGTDEVVLAALTGLLLLAVAAVLLRRSTRPVSPAAGP